MKLRHVIVLFLLALASRESMAATDSVSVTVDTLTDGWRICVEDIRVNPGITSIVVASSGDNCELLASDAKPSIDNHVKIADTQSVVCFTVLRMVPSWRSKIILSIERVNFKYTEYTVNGRQEYDCDPVSGGIHSFFVYNYKDSQLVEMTIRNPVWSNKQLAIDDISLENGNANFYISAISKALPIVLNSGDSLSVVIKFQALQIGWMFDRLAIKRDIKTDHIILQGVLRVGKISCHDLDFGEVFLGERVCDKVTIRNSGDEYFTLLMQDSSHQSINKLYFTEGDVLPSTIATQSGHEFQYCYEPEFVSQGDTMFVKWVTDIDSSFLGLMVDSSIIVAYSSVPDVKWNKAYLKFQADSTQSVFLTTIFHNHAPAGTFVKRFYISGADSAEFEIFNSLSPLSNVTMLRNETDWFDIAFKPDMTKPLNERYTDRHATLVAELADSNVTMELIGTFNPLHVKHELAIENISFSPNPVYGQDATLSFALPEPKQLSISIYDILGREVISIPSQYYSSGSFSNIIATSKLGDGSYILRVSDGSSTKSIGFRVVK